MKGLSVLKHVLVFAALFSPAVAYCQVAPSAFGLRSDTIGESLVDFRTRNHRVDPKQPVIEGIADSQAFPKCSGDLDLSKLPPLPKTGESGWGVKFNAYSKGSFYSLQEKSLDRSAKTYGGDRDCEVGPYSGGTVADAPATLHYSFKEDRLDSIAATFDRSENFAQVKQAIISKYGQPTKVESHEYRNEAGAVLKGEVSLWVGPSSVIRLTEFSDDLARSSLWIFNPKTQLNRMQSDQKKANADF